MKQKMNNNSCIIQRTYISEKEIFKTKGEDIRYKRSVLVLLGLARISIR